MKMTSLSLAMAGLLGAGAAQAAFFAGSSTYTVSVSGGCFAFGDCTGLAQNVGTGSFTLTTDATGGAFDVGSYSGIDFTGTPGGLFSTGGPVAGTGSVSAGGSLDLDFTGRTGTAQYFPQYAGAAWNLDNNTKVPSTGVYEGFTSGADSNLDPNTGAVALTLTGTALSLTSSAAGIGTWTGTIVSVGNVGAQWTSFDGTPYSEVYNISVSGAVPPAVIPVPAAVWLFGSGLVGLMGVARRRRKAAA